MNYVRNYCGNYQAACISILFVQIFIYSFKVLNIMKVQPGLEDVVGIKDKSATEFSTWLVDGIQRHLDGDSSSSNPLFEPVEVWIGHFEDLTEDLGQIYRALPNSSKSNFRQGVNEAIRNVYAEDYSPTVMKELLFLAGRTRAIEAVYTLPTNYNHMNGTKEKKELYKGTLELLAAMASWDISVPEKAAVQNKLYEIVESEFFGDELYMWSDTALIALCQCSPDSLPKHLASLRPYINKAFSKVEEPPDSSSNLASQLISVVGPKYIADHLNEMYRDYDLWILVGLHNDGKIERKNGNLFLLHENNSYEIKIGENPALKRSMNIIREYSAPKKP